ncbi:Hypothetical predicted protein [Lecanosticta acicola]|uniref:Uncharacterized protein n=1 Tax=Lecanosticta acicola TaxID=111012 RepID=A0AAI8Z7N5_9PEZI|nr:Hypothetical predicted protein [Lecanosticta acicola]
MLNAKALTELLSHHRDDRLCKRWYLMTPNGTLLAYSQPTDINDLRRQAAIAAITWQEHQHPAPDGHLADSFQGEIREDGEPQQPLHVLSVESEASNVLLRQIQPQLLLVLEGGVPPRRAGFGRRVTAESADGTQQQWPHHQGDNASLRSNATATATATNGGGGGGSSSAVAASVLKLHRGRLDALADAIISDFQQTGFQMPAEGSTTMTF